MDVSIPQVNIFYSEQLHLFYMDRARRSSYSYDVSNGDRLAAVKLHNIGGNFVLHGKGNVFRFLCVLLIVCIVGQVIPWKAGHGEFSIGALVAASGISRVEFA